MIGTSGDRETKDLKPHHGGTETRRKPGLGIAETGDDTTLADGQVWKGGTCFAAAIRDSMMNKIKEIAGCESGFEYSRLLEIDTSELSAYSKRIRGKFKNLPKDAAEGPSRWVFPFQVCFG